MIHLSQNNFSEEVVNILNKLMMSFLLILGIILWFDFLLDFLSWRLTISRRLNRCSRLINDLSFFREVKEKDLNVLGSKTVANSLNDEFHVWPIL
jgi:hypothetical protein